jgi:hypothetical protein
MSNSKSIKEIYRIRELMLYEQFGGNENMIPKYVEQVINKMGGEVPFERFFNGEATLREFRENLIEKIKVGDYGNDFSEVNNSLQYLKRLKAILGTLERQHEKDPEKFKDLDKFLFGDEGSSENPLEGLFEKVLYGDFCNDCKSSLDVSDKLNEVIEARKQVNQIVDDKAEELEQLKRKTSDPREMEQLMKKLYGDYYGLISFFTKGHTRRGQDILDKYDLRDPHRVSMGKNRVMIELLSDVNIDSDCGNVRWEAGKQLNTEYVESENQLVHKVKDQKCIIYIVMRDRPQPNSEHFTKIEKIVPLTGGDLQVEPSSKKIKFRVMDPNENLRSGRPKKPKSK